MTGKAFTGALKVAGAAAPAVLTNAICCYFGILFNSFKVAMVNNINFILLK